MKDDDYNPTSHTLTILMVLAVCLAVILSLLASCRTVHEVEHVYTHDTLIVHHTDTFVHTKTLHVHDTTRQVEHHYITLNQAGDTTKEVHYYHDTEHTIVVDSTDRYKAKNDSLQRLLDREREKEKVVEKKPSFLEFMKVTGIGFLIAVGIILFIRWRVNKESNDKR